MMINNIQIIKKKLNEIGSIPGVINSILVHRNGNPISSSGIWLNEADAFGCSNSITAIFNIAEKIHQKKIQQILIEGEKIK